jgi:hypothetical protein
MSLIGTERSFVRDLDWSKLKVLPTLLGILLGRTIGCPTRTAAAYQWLW